MFFFNTKQIVGLDIGQSTVKAVVLRRQGKTVQIQAGKLLDCREEGILDAIELYEQLPKWLEENGWKNRELLVSLPQYLTTTRVTDFPPSTDHDLEKMVAIETHELAGLSEESFVSDHCPLGARPGRNNPVLIVISKSSAVAERADRYKESGLRLTEFGIPGLALANAYLALYPEAAAAAEPQLLLDIGTDSSTLVILAGGNLLFISTMMFGANRYTQALAKHLGVTEEQAEKAKVQIALNAADPDSPLLAATRVLENEIRTEIEHWRAQECPEMAHKMFGRICLSGGGARLPGLAAYLGRSLGCPAEVVGMPGASDSQEREPRYMIAYGLALQGVNGTGMSIALAPPSVHWLTLRRRNFRYLCFAAALLIIGLLWGAIWLHQDLIRNGKKLSSSLSELNRCSQLIPKLEDVMAETSLRERMLVPLVAKGNRARHFIDALKALATAKGREDWLIYMADWDSYNLPAQGESAAGNKVATAARPATTAPAGGLLPLSGADIGIASLPQEFPGRMTSANLSALQTLIIAGYSPLNQASPYQPVRDIVEKLNATELFENVDILPETERAGRDDIFQPWVNLFKDHTDLRYKAFILRVPFAKPDVYVYTAAKKAEIKPKK